MEEGTPTGGGLEIAHGLDGLGEPTGAMTVGSSKLSSTGSLSSVEQSSGTVKVRVGVVVG